MPSSAASACSARCMKKELFDPETGELMDYEAFAPLHLEREEKVEGLALWVKDLTARAKAVMEIPCPLPGVFPGARHSLFEPAPPIFDSDSRRASGRGQEPY